MLHAPTSENKQPGNPTRTQPSQEKAREVYPHSGTVPGRTAKQAAILILQRSIGNQAVLRLLDQRTRNQPAGQGDAGRSNPPQAQIPLAAPPGTLQAKLVVGPANDPLEQEADRVAEQVMRMPDPGSSMKPGSLQLSRKCAACEEEEKAQRLQTKPAGTSEAAAGEAPSIVHEVLRSPGQPLDAPTRAFFEPRFGLDLGHVRLHDDARAAESAHAVGALGYTVGRHIAFASGRYAPGTDDGRRLIAHELAHVVQQGGGNGPDLRRLGDVSQVPQVLPCAVPTDTAPPATDFLLFPNLGTTLTAAQKAQIGAFVDNWKVAGNGATVRVDGFASNPGDDALNWQLSCDRATAVKAELMNPSASTGSGIPEGSITLFMQGKTSEFGAEEQNRRVTLFLPSATPSQPPVTPMPPVTPSPAPCTLPLSLGSARGCGSGSDFTHFDFPSISVASEAKLAAWAAARNSLHLPLRSLVSDADCELEMDGVLYVLAGGAGHAAFSRFAAGTGGTETHGPASTLGSMALGCGSFLATVARVKANIEAQLATQAASGVLNPCALSVTPPATHFAFSDGTALKAVIGGTQGEQLFAIGFTGSIPMRSYSIDLRFVICDDFGVDESDLYAPGLFAFWVLQHERSATLYAPFINQLDLPVTVKGTF